MSIKRISLSVFGAVSALFISVFFISCSCGQMQSVNVDEFEKRLIETKGEQLIDVRTSQEFEKYRIASAVNIDLKSNNFQKELEQFDKSKPILVYCLSGGRSKQAMTLLHKAGFKTVYELEGGINAWSKAERPIDQDLSGIGEIASEDYKNIISTKGYVLVDYYAPWCGPCQKMLPMANDLAKAYPDKFRLLTVNFDQNRLLAKEQKITSVPYLAVFKDGERIWDKNGEASKEELIKILELYE